MKKIFIVIKFTQSCYYCKALPTKMIHLRILFNLFSSFCLFLHVYLICLITIEILILYSWNLKYNRIDMKKRTSQKIIRQSRKIDSSTKQLTLTSTASDSLKAPKKKQERKNRNFGQDITNLPK